MNCCGEDLTYGTTLHCELDIRPKSQPGNYSMGSTGHSSLNSASNLTLYLNNIQPKSEALKLTFPKLCLLVFVFI